MKSSATHRETQRERERKKERGPEGHNMARINRAGGAIDPEVCGLNGRRAKSTREAAATAAK